ncbi:hypothetical protein HDV01_001437 [Terramyces sp. JEL0728]|nr:hypothetical protein HDV01_001437 [Terramyces sp. JEL0728]
MDSDADLSPDEEDPLPMDTAQEDVPSEKKDKKKKKKKKKKKGKRIKLPKDMVMNDRGEIVTVKEYVLEKTASTNETLQENLISQEKDALQVIAALHKESEKKDSQIKDLLINAKRVEENAEKARETVMQEYTQKVEDMAAILNEKEAAFKIMQQEFTVIKDFRRKRHDLLKELEESKAELLDTERRHQEIITRLEKKFFEEKIRLQKEANEKISELATKAHKEAVSNLKHTTKDVYKENIRISEALLYHVQDGQELGRINTDLETQNKQLLQEKELHSVIVKEKIIHSRNQELELKQLKQKIQNMEHALTHVVTEFEQERQLIGQLAKKELEEVKKVVSDLTNRLTTKAVEMKHIKVFHSKQKRLAQHILDQRTELEVFFMESLETVKDEQRKLKVEEMKRNQDKYKQNMRDVLKNTIIPPLKPLKPIPGSEIHQTLKLGANKEFEPAPKPKVDIKELSWEDKEKILRILFAKMNGISLANEQEKKASGVDRDLDKASKHRTGFLETEAKYTRNLLNSAGDSQFHATSSFFTEEDRTTPRPNTNTYLPTVSENSVIV